MNAEKLGTGPVTRLTKGCKKVLEVLERNSELTTAQDIHSQLRTEDFKAPGLTTVYRSLESLVSLGLVQAVDLGDGERRYESRIHKRF
jgi:Fur family ferric uptake transcriptional regulator